MRLRLLAALPALCLAPAVATAQIHASEHFTLTQKVSTTTIALEGDRPVARGRTLFGPDGVVKWGETWTPGANWATTIEVDRDVTVDGHPLPKGKYSLWLMPQVAPAAWSLSFSRATHRFHTRPPGADDEQLRVSVKPEQVGMHMETLAWYMPVVMPDGVTLRLHWGTTSVPLQIGVEMPRLATLPSDQVPAYVGTYKTHITPVRGDPFDVNLIVQDEAGTLTVKSQPRDIFGNRVVMLPVVDGRFHTAYPSVGTFKGQYYAEKGMIFAFKLDGDRATSFEMYGYDDNLVGRGERVK